MSPSLALLSLLHVATPTPPTAPAPPFAPAPTAHEPTAADRAIAGSGAALGGVVGGVVGASSALMLGAAAAGFNSDAGAIPFFVLPPALSALGAGAAGAAVGGSSAMWAGGVAALAGSGVATVVVELAVLPDAGSTNAPTGLLIIAVGAPALVGGIAAGATAAVFTDAPP